MTQKKSSKELEVKVEDNARLHVLNPDEKPELDIEVRVEGETPTVEEPTKEVEVKQEEDVEALRKQLQDLKGAQELSQAREREAAQQAQQAAAQVGAWKQSAEQSQYDSILTAMGAAQMEVDSAKRDIMLAGSAQDFEALANAQERLSTAKAHQVNLEQGKNAYESQRNQPQATQTLEAGIDANPNLSYDEKSWLKSHPEALSDQRKNAKLNAAYFDAMDKGLQRGSREYFNFIDEQLGYRQAPQVEQPARREESSVMVAAPPSKSVPPGAGPKTSYTLTREEAEVARLSNITPAEYVKQKIQLQELKKSGHYNSQG